METLSPVTGVALLAVRMAVNGVAASYLSPFVPVAMVMAIAGPAALVVGRQLLRMAIPIDIPFRLSVLLGMLVIMLQVANELIPVHEEVLIGC